MLTTGLEGTQIKGLTSSNPISVLPRYLRLGGLPGLIIHWKVVAAWLKIKDLSKWMLMLTSRKGTSGTKSLNNVEETLSMVFLLVCFLVIN